MRTHNPIFERANPYLKFVLFISIVVVSMIICMTLGFLLALPLFKINFLELLNALSQSNNPEYVNILKYFQAVSQLGLFIVPSLLFPILVSKSIKNYLHLNKPIQIVPIILSVLIMLTAIPFINWLADLNAQIQLPSSMAGIEQWMKSSEEAAAKITELFLNVSSFSGLLINFLVVALIAAIGEELFFRGIVQKLLHQWFKNIHLAIFFAAFLFGAFHLQFYGIVPRMLMGVLFGYLLYWSGSIWICIIAHFTNNAFAIIIDFFTRKKQIDFDIDKLGLENNGWIYLLSSIFLICILILVLYQIEKRKSKILNPSH